MMEFWPFMTDKNKERYNYMKNKHEYFLSKLGRCETSKILAIDKKIPGSRSTLRNIIFGIKDKSDNHKIFNSIDIHWDNPSIYVLTFRPDKKSLAYSFNSSLPTYVKNLYPNTNLSHIFTLDALDQAQEETYHPSTQRFTTIEDLAMMREIQDDADDSSMEGYMADGPELPDGLEDDDIDPPVQEITNPKLFDLSGRADSVSTMASQDNLSVTFSEHTSVGQDSILEDQSIKTPSTAQSDTLDDQKTAFLELVRDSDDINTIQLGLQSFLANIQLSKSKSVASAHIDEQATENP